MSEKKKELTKEEKLKQKLQTLMLERQQFLNQSLELNKRVNIWEGRIEEVSIQLKELEEENK